MIAYISHPYTGNEQENVKEAEIIAIRLTHRYQDIVFINPLSSMKHEGLAGLDYSTVINHCLALLRRCDVLIMTGEWRKSRGCLLEREFAHKNKIPVYDSIEAFEEK